MIGFMLVNNQFYMRMFIVQGEKTNNISAPKGSKALFFGSDTFYP